MQKSRVNLNSPLIKGKEEHITRHISFTLEQHFTIPNQVLPETRPTRQLTGQMGLSPANCRKVMTACIQSVAKFGSELWRKGDHVQGTVGRADELQLLVNQEARATTGCFRTTNLGALSKESGL